MKSMHIILTRQLLMLRECLTLHGKMQLFCRKAKIFFKYLKSSVKRALKDIDSVEENLDSLFMF